MSTVAEPDVDEAAPPVHVTISIPEDPSLGDAQVLPPPLTAAETRALRDSFSWETMTPLRETDREGRPILEYALVYITSREAHEALTQLDLHHSYLPLFESERARWDGLAGIFTHEGDGRGVFAYAFLPAGFINEERRLALAGEPAFDAILVREVPEPAARARDGGVSYEWLRAEHFLYDGRAYVAPASSGDSDVGGAREALAGAELNRIATAAANAAEAFIEGVRRGIGAFDRWWNGSARLYVRVTPLNTDPSFVSGSPMLQGWGDRRGVGLSIEGQPVHVSQGVSLFVADTNATGAASMLVVKDRAATVCVESEAPAAYITRFLVPSSLCAGRTRRVTTGMWIEARVRAQEMNVLAQLDDARGYVRAVHGYRTRQPKVALGGVADIVTLVNGGRAFAPCFDAPFISPVDTIGWVASLLDLAAPGVGTTLGTSAEFLLDYDLFIPTTQDADRSRGVPTHEYGHFVMCDMLLDEGAYVSTWIPMVLQFAQGRGDTASQLNEAFADFISSQVVGGVNYFQTSVGPPSTGNRDSLGQQWYCDPASSLCVDDNIGGPPTSAALPFGQVATDAEVTYSWSPASDTGLFIQRTARMMTTITDAFDGQASGGNVPGNGAAWTFVEPNFIAPVHDSFSLNDEVITLAAAPGYRGSGVNLHDVVRTFTEVHGGRLDEQFFRAMTRVMHSVGYTDTEICQLYVLHEYDGVCPEAFFDTPPDIVPRAPFDLNHVLAPSNEATWSWRDDSPLPGDHFHYQVVVESTGVVIEDGVLPYATMQSFGPYPLRRYDNRFIFRVQTVSSTGHESAWTVDGLCSFAERARNLHMVDVPPYTARVPLAWDRVQATTYGVFVTDVSRRREEASGLSVPAYELILLDGGMVTVEVVSYNQDGAASAPSIPITVSVDPAPILYVAPGGDDTADGGPATPLGTIEAAIARAGSTSDVVTIRIAGLWPYTYTPLALTVPPGVIVRLEGGYPTTSWVRTTKPTFVVTSTAVLTGGLTGCGVPEAVPDGEWAAGVRVGSGAKLYLDQLDLTVVPADGHCTAAVALERAGLELRASELAVQLGVAGECAVGVLGDGSGAWPVTLTARESSEISGAKGASLTNSALHAAAVCLHSAATVILEDTTLTGLVASSSSTLLRAQAASGLVLSQSSAVEIVRSTIRSVTSGPRGMMGVQTGVLLVRMLGGVRLANSVVSTTRGSDSNVAISAHSLGGAGSLSLFYVTALAGDDYDRTVSLPLDHRSAPIALLGAPGSVRILNSILANGAGLGETGLQTVIAGIDRGMDRMTADPRTFELRGTAISFPFRDYYQSEALTYCEPDSARFLRNIYHESDLNYAPFHRCYPVVAGGSSYTAAGNLAFNFGPDETSVLGRPAIRFSWDGHPLATPPVVPGDPWGTIAIDTLRAAGVELTGEPVGMSDMLTLDLGGVMRIVTPPGIGAWVLPMPVTP